MNALNTQPYSDSPPRSRATTGITVTTASASDATKVIVRTRPAVSARRCGAHSPRARPSLIGCPVPSSPARPPGARPAPRLPCAAPALRRARPPGAPAPPRTRPPGARALPAPALHAVRPRHAPCPPPAPGSRGIAGASLSL